MMRLLSDAIGALPESLIRLGIRVTGRTVVRADHKWLDSPVGPPGRIGEAFFDRLAKQQGLDVRRGSPDAGLIADFATLRGPEFDPDKIRPEVRHFYEHTALYELETWNETSLFSRPFLWLLVKLVSHGMDFAGSDGEGKPASLDSIRRNRIVVDGNNWTVVSQGKSSKGTFRLDAVPTPGTLDVTFTEGSEKGKTYLGIYELQGDNLKLCRVPAGKERPTAFVRKSGNEVLETYRRAAGGSVNH
jgi:uncharacterized protein (TIGR03067 family)